MEIIQLTVSQPQFQATPASQKAMDNLLLAAQVQAALVKEVPSARVEGKKGELLVSMGVAWGDDERLIAKVDQIVDEVGGIKVKVRLIIPKPYPAPILFWSTVVTKLLATLFVVYPFGLITPISWKDVGIVWTYCIAWLFMGDMAKLTVLRHLEMSGRRHQTFMRLLEI